ncbi:MAG: hypothetical protein J2P24_15335 [Streptosporangiales bacterium]|nr:hypothetical protein [Streptosporangiales bacterium]MBO0892321.1 hypothetical protein [Acidothermales bacterium]
MTVVADVSAVRWLHDAWTAANEAVPGVPRWARVAAHAVPFTVLPASVWRIAVCTFHAPIAHGLGGPDIPSNIPGMPLEVYVVLLSVASELVAFTAVGLVARWGEVWPRWLPGLRGRRVPPLAAVISASLGAAVLTALWTWVAVMFSLGLRVDGTPLVQDVPLGLADWQGVLATVTYAPLLLWGPLLGAVTVAYARRRRAYVRRTRTARPRRARRSGRR